MNTMAYTYGFDQSYDPERSTYDDPTIYHPDAPPLFTQQELCGFEPAHYTLGQSNFPMIGGGGGEDMSTAMESWEQEVSSKSMGYNDMASQYYSHIEPSGYDMNMGMGYPQEGSDGYYSCYQEDMATAGSCQASPFVDQTRLPPPPFQTSSFQHPLSPVTPSGSPLMPQQYACNPGLAEAPSAFLLVPVQSNGQYQYNAYPVPMAQLPVNDTYLDQLAYQDNQSAAFESQHPSPYTIPSLTASPLATESRTSVDEEEDEEDEDEEDEEEEDDRSVIPNHGNKELRGMGLYDDTPDLTYPGCSTPASYSPITPHDQLRPTLGKGLVLERSFGLPEKMMIKDEKTGEIIEGKLRIDDEEETSWASSPRLYNDDEDMY